MLLSTRHIGALMLFFDARRCCHAMLLMPLSLKREQHMRRCHAAMMFADAMRLMLALLLATLWWLIARATILLCLPAY